MCGIIGFNFEDKFLLKKGMNLLQHRGPDDSGHYIDKNISLGHRRLSIIDLKTGKQPMFYKHFTVIYNGEIYNFKEIKKQLKKHKFKTTSDTEVILHAYEEYGTKCLDYFNGMFAFCIYDRKNKILFLARDRIGIKPLYYYFKDGKFIFASEIKAILQDKTIKRELNNETLVDYLTFQNILDEKTFFKDIFILEPGYYLLFDLKTKKLIKNQYYDFNFDKVRLTKDEYIKKFKKIFTESVKRHLISDVPLGSYLSGGFDSTSVATIASEYIKKIQTFTGKFNDLKYDETKCSRVAKDKINAIGNEILIKPGDFIKSIKKIIYHLDEPKVALPAFSQYYVSKLVSEKVKVVLTGHAGDELFSGYPIYKAIYYKELFKKNPLNIFKMFTAFNLSEIPRSLYFIFFSFFQKEVKHGLFIMFNKNQRKKMFTKFFYNKIKDYNSSTTIKKIFDKELNNIDKIQYIYLKTYLPSLLIVEDKMGMAHSIEARTPICDNELVDFALSIPMKYKIYNNTLKYIIKESMKDKLPEILYKGAKRGFPTPLGKWFRKELRSYIYSILLDEKTKNRGIFNMNYIKKILDNHCNSKTDTLLDLVNANKIWSLLSIEMWFRIFIDSDHP